MGGGVLMRGGRIFKDFGLFLKMKIEYICLTPFRDAKNNCTFQTVKVDGFEFDTLCFVLLVQLLTKSCSRTTLRNTSAVTLKAQVGYRLPYASGSPLQNFDLW